MTTATAQDRMPAAKLVCDYRIYPRERLDSYNVRSMVEALRAGRELPPIVVDRETLRIVDGFHRLKAWRKFLGPDCEVPVTVKSYADEAAIFADAMELNANHGRKLSPYDQTRCIIIAGELQIDDDYLASAMNITIEKLGDLRQTRMAEHEAEPIVLKQTMSHLSGQKLSDRQAKWLPHAGGLNITFYVNQIIGALEHDCVDRTDEKVVVALEALQKALHNFLGGV